MKIALLGATGNSGLELLKQGLARGHEITAIVRSPAKLSAFKDKENLKIVTADLMNPEELASHFAGQDCVLSALGAPGVHFFPITFYKDSMKSITSAMNKANVTRLICITAFYTRPNDGTYPMIYKLLLRAMIGRQLDDMYEMEKFLMNETESIDYTIVRPPRLTDEALSDVELLTKEDAYLFVDVKSKNQTPRANVARFMLDTLENNTFVKKAVAIDLPMA